MHFMLNKCLSVLFNNMYYPDAPYNPVYVLIYILK